MSRTINLEHFKRVSINSKFDEIKLKVLKSNKTYFELEEDIDSDLFLEKEGEDSYFIKFTRDNDSFLNKFFGFMSNDTFHATLYVSEEFEELKINFTQGDIYLENIELNFLDNKIITGNTNIKNCKIKNNKTKLITGNFHADNSDLINEEISVTTGNIRYKDSKIQNIDCHLITGNVKIDSLNSNFDLIKLKIITGDASLSICGKEPIYITKKLTPYSATLKSNIDLIEKDDVDMLKETRKISVKAITGNVKIKGIEQDQYSSQSINEEKTNQPNQKMNSEDFLTQEEKKILDLLKQKKISYDFALELLSEMGYDNQQAEKFLNDRGISR
ncbi:MAG: DUF4097 family beta strand repeat-containing protein [Thermotogota bacterium]